MPRSQVHYPAYTKFYPRNNFSFYIDSALAMFSFLFRHTQLRRRAFHLSLFLCNWLSITHTVSFVFLSPLPHESQAKLYKVDKWSSLSQFSQSLMEKPVANRKLCYQQKRFHERPKTRSIKSFFKFKKDFLVIDALHGNCYSSSTEKLLIEKEYFKLCKKWSSQYIFFEYY